MKDDNKPSSSKTLPSVSSSSVPLPLEWTKINRSKKRKIKSNGDDETDYLFCCEDPACEKKGGEHSTSSNTTNTNEINARDQIATINSSAASEQELAKNLKNEQKKPPPTHNMASLKGKGLFCLHSLDCKWFQGHFIPSRMNSSSFGLLAVERDDLDECLQCRDGGYREIDLTILSASKKRKSDDDDDNGNKNDNKTKKRNKLKVDKLQCTGGDMLRITTSNRTTTNAENGKNIQVTFDAERIITGSKAESLVKRYFRNLVPNSKNTDSLSDILPECAIVTGDMHIVMPSKFVYGRDPNDEINDTDDDWLE